MAIPRVQTTWYRQPAKAQFACDLALACGALLGGIPATRKYYVEQSLRVAAATGSGTALVFAGATVRAYLNLRDRLRKDSTHDLVGCLHALRGALEMSAEEPIDAGVRATVHVPTPDGQYLEQACDYVCGDKTRGRKTAGRKFAVNCGAIGLAYRKGKMLVGTRTNTDNLAHVEELVTSWGFTREQAGKLDPTAMSWMAVPLQSTSHGVEGIVYLDARKRDFFTENRQQIILGCCLGIALFVEHRYTN